MAAPKFALKHYPERERMHKWEVFEVATGYLFLSTDCEKTARSELDRLNGV